MTTSPHQACRADVSHLSWTDVIVYDKRNSLTQSDRSYFSEENDLEIKIGLKGKKKEICR